MRAILAVSLAILTSGCAGSLVGDAIAGPEALAKRDDAYCQSIGAAPGSERYYACRMTMTQSRDARHTARLQMMQQSPAVVIQQQQTVVAPR